MKCVDCIRSFYTYKPIDGCVGMQFRCSKFQLLLMPIGDLDPKTFIKETSKLKCIKKEEEDGRNLPRETQSVVL